MARDERFPGTGSLLLTDALVRAYLKSVEIASLTVVADAKDEAALKFYPNRTRGFFGAARAAEAAGQKAKAADYYARLVALTAKADGTRPEISRAKSFLAQR